MWGKASYRSPYQRNLNKLPDHPTPHAPFSCLLPHRSSSCTWPWARPLRNHSHTPWNLIPPFSLCTPLIPAGTKTKLSCYRSMCPGESFPCPFSMPSCSSKSFIAYGWIPQESIKLRSLHGGSRRRSREKILCWEYKIFKRSGEDRRNSEKEKDLSSYLPIILNSHIIPEQDITLCIL